MIYFDSIQNPSCSSILRVIICFLNPTSPAT
uniref:Uncharacterized protein n=1 Tax=Arundo donax TaxID=35708 RepID=A0A0A8ZEY7_ARUDO